MSPGKPVDTMKLCLLPNSDPLGIKDTALGGAPPLLSVEAQIAVGHWLTNNGSEAKKKVDAKSHEKS